jgi:uncharacterized protein (TIGR02996 family)
VGVADEEGGFLEAIKGDPESSDAREVYADWLEERGRQERAEYLRLEAEVRAFDFVTGNPEREQKVARRDTLEDQLQKSDAKWLADVSRVVRVRVAHPRPAGIGRAEPIPAPRSSTATPEPRSTDITAMRVSLDTGPMPAPSGGGRWERRLLTAFIVAAFTALLIKDITTPGFFERLLHDIYVRGHF